MWLFAVIGGKGPRACLALSADRPLPLRVGGREPGRAWQKTRKKGGEQPGKLMRKGLEREGSPGLRACRMAQAVPSSRQGQEEGIKETGRLTWSAAHLGSLRGT